MLSLMILLLFIIERVHSYPNEIYLNDRVNTTESSSPEYVWVISAIVVSTMVFFCYFIICYIAVALYMDRRGERIILLDKKNIDLTIDKELI